jgi:hypothetical protein
VLGKHPFEGNSLRFVTHDGLINRRVKSEEAIAQLCTRRRLHDKDIDKADPTPLGDVDHAHAASRETRIDRQNAHGRELVLLELGENLVADIKVAVDVLHVLTVFECL